jgi:hypothetical protein
MNGLAAYRVTARSRLTGQVVDLGIVEAVGPTAARMRAEDAHRQRTGRRFHPRDYDITSAPAPLVWRRS